jgi:hypothetical protein
MPAAVVVKVEHRLDGRHLSGQRSAARIAPSTAATRGIFEERISGVASRVLTGTMTAPSQGMAYKTQ